MLTRSQTKKLATKEDDEFCEGHFLTDNLPKAQKGKSIFKSITKIGKKTNKSSKGDNVSLSSSDSSDTESSEETDKVDKGTSKPEQTVQTEKMATGGTSDINKDLETVVYKCFDKLFELRQADQAQFATIGKAIEDKNSQGSQHLGVKLPTFSGTEKEDIHQFLQKFKQVCDFYKWEPAKRAAALPVSLEGHAAIWFNALPESAKISFQAMEKELRDKFDPVATQWRLRQSLGQRKQRTGERISDYAADIRRQCSRLNLPKDDWVHIFLNGLLPDIKAYCVLQQPKSFEEAENLAMLKESVLDSEARSVSAVLPQLKDLIVNEVKSSLAPTNKNVAAFNPAISQADKTAHSGQSPQTQTDLQTLQKQMHALTYRLDNLQKGRSFNRGARFRFGTARYFNCGILGHTASTCNRKVAGDPRIPNQNRSVRSNQHPSNFQPTFQRRPFQQTSKQYQGN